MATTEDDAGPRKASRAYRARVAVEAWEAEVERIATRMRALGQRVAK